MTKRHKAREMAKEDLRKRRELAKAGMAASMGGVLLTGMLKKKKAHIVTGVAFMGFAYWHTTLYAQNPNKKRLVDPYDAAPRDRLSPRRETEEPESE
ncbi:hypothetical protein L3Q72_17525 [Vibrio sp. JC009]|uniref:hypothetical protein n=1 Tax=Vibrio sp. JC009 TaxID=2912314 RepID=UPI0023B1CE2B|nr:hypothetical protein [Vibrio sp. JC009]WED24676.1 hypothetical protein L3Q72_17525 [Vibrio sp. JC009]